MARRDKDRERDIVLANKYYSTPHSSDLIKNEFAEDFPDFSRSSDILAEDDVYLIEKMKQEGNLYKRNKKRQ